MAKFPPLSCVWNFIKAVVLIGLVVLSFPANAANSNATTTEEHTYYQKRANRHEEKLNQLKHRFDYLDNSPAAATTSSTKSPQQQQDGQQQHNQGNNNQNRHLRYQHRLAAAAASTTKTTLYDFQEKKLEDGQEVDFSEFEGDVVLMVNVASHWGLTETSYTQLLEMADQLGPKGLKILAFPSNQFGDQEPGTADEILEFVKKYDDKITSKILFFEKGNVNGSKARDVYKWITRELPSNQDGKIDISWNFEKFLVDSNGKPYKRYDPKIEPWSLRQDIMDLIEQAGA